MIHVDVKSKQSGCSIKEINYYKKRTTTVIALAYDLLIKKQIIKNTSDKDLFVNILFINDAQMQKYNLKYRGNNSTTNVLSFQYESKQDILTGNVSNPCYLGDIFISINYINKESVEYNISLLDHLTRIIIHGFLHVLGFDHIIPKEENEMKSLEDIILSCCKIDAKSIID